MVIKLNRLCHCGRIAEYHSTYLITETGVRRMGDVLCSGCLDRMIACQATGVCEWVRIEVKNENTEC